MYVRLSMHLRNMFVLFRQVCSEWRVLPE